MSEELVITAVGPDRPGITSEFSGHVHRAGANLADARMINLRGRFALVALVLGDRQTLDNTRRVLEGAAREMGLAIEFSSAEKAPPRGGVPFRLRSYSMDQPGIVHKLTRYLHEQGVNIEELETRLESAPFMGTPVFTMTLVMLVPNHVSVKALRHNLDELGGALNCDIDLDPA
ncbi:glycine cleavage system protein R [Pendulispora albinea]|uniref:ACT domain-containing protein n=1 Tax=Pendulispora albinea TaxID=2741071 RepID=A0ABZ2LPB9_9BACT